MNMTTLIGDIGTAITGIIGWVGNVIKAMFATATDGDAVAGAWAAVLPLVLLGVGVSFVMLGVRIYKWVTTFI